MDILLHHPKFDECNRLEVIKNHEAILSDLANKVENMQIHLMNFFEDYVVFKLESEFEFRNIYDMMNSNKRKTKKLANNERKLRHLISDGIINRRVMNERFLVIPPPSVLGPIVGSSMDGNASNEDRNCHSTDSMIMLSIIIKEELNEEEANGKKVYFDYFFTEPLNEKNAVINVNGVSVYPKFYNGIVVRVIRFLNVSLVSTGQKIVVLNVKTYGHDITYYMDGYNETALQEIPENDRRMEILHMKEKRSYKYVVQVVEKSGINETKKSKEKRLSNQGNRSHVPEFNYAITVIDEKGIS
uniref:DUF4140 domain-containing protein n=1 Tax=Strongyloides papillosus TaxID=174720 RepID=A0A0N5C6F8_STREA